MDDGRQYLSQATYYNEDGMYDAAGNQASYRYIIYKTNGSEDYRGSNTTQYAAFDTYKELKVTASWTKSGDAGYTVSRYSDRGELLQVEVKGAKTYTKMFASNREGQLITAKRSDGGAQSYIYVQGRELANVGNANTPELTDTVEQITMDTFGLAPTNYVVSQGDTLQSIALNVWGDDAMWYLIADANGLAAGEALTPGDSLKIPNVLGSTHNDSNDFKPYNPRDVIGDNTPQPKPPKPKKKKKKSGGLSSIVMAVVAVVAAVFTAGAALAAFAPGLAAGAATAAGATSTMGMLAAAGTAALTGGAGLAGVAAAVVGGMAGSAASQLSGMAMGVVDDFSWSQVAIGGLSAGFTAGIGAAAQAGTFGTFAKSAAGYLQRTDYIGYSSSAVLRYGSNQVIDRVSNVDTAFSWRALASSVISANVGGYLGAGKAGKAENWRQLAEATARDYASEYISQEIASKWLGTAEVDPKLLASTVMANGINDYFNGMYERDKEGKNGVPLLGVKDSAARRATRTVEKLALDLLVSEVNERYLGGEPINHKDLIRSALIDGAEKYVADDLLSLLNDKIDNDIYNFDQDYNCSPLETAANDLLNGYNGLGRKIVIDQLKSASKGVVGRVLRDEPGTGGLPVTGAEIDAKLALAETLSGYAGDEVERLLGDYYRNGSNSDMKRLQGLDSTRRLSWSEDLSAKIIARQLKELSSINIRRAWEIDSGERFNVDYSLSQVRKIFKDHAGKEINEYIKEGWYQEKWIDVAVKKK